MKNRWAHRQIHLQSFLKDARIQAGLTQKEVAEHLGYSTAQFVSSWERAEREPPMNVIWKLASLFHLSAEKIFETMLLYRTQALSIDFALNSMQRNLEIFDKW